MVEFYALYYRIILIDGFLWWLAGCHKTVSAHYLIPLMVRMLKPVMLVSNIGLNKERSGN